MKLRTLLAAGALVAYIAAGSAYARDLTVAVREDAAPASILDTLREIAIKPFVAAGGPPTTIVGWQGGLDALKFHAGEWDLVSVAMADAQPGCDQGLFEKLDWAAIGGRDHYLALGTNDCAVGAFATATVLAWDRDKFASVPTWADFWDVAKFPGKRGLRKGVQGNLEIALMADGVAPGDVYRTLRGSDGVSRAFRKLDQLKPYLVFWPTGADAIHILGSGEVLMTSAPSSGIAAASRDERRNYAMQWSGNLTSAESWAIVKASPNSQAALKLLAFLGDPKLQAKLPSAALVGGTAKGANDGLPADQQALSPTLQANLDKGVAIDEAYWRENRDKLSQQFDAWLAR